MFLRWLFGSKCLFCFFVLFFLFLFPFLSFPWFFWLTFAQFLHQTMYIPRRDVYVPLAMNTENQVSQCWRQGECQQTFHVWVGVAEPQVHHVQDSQHVWVFPHTAQRGGVRHRAVGTDPGRDVES